MSKTLQTLKSEITKARNLTYFGRYNDSLNDFTKIQSKIQSEMFSISDKNLLSEWNKLLEEIKFEKQIVQSSIAILSGNYQIQIPIRGGQQASDRHIKTPENHYRQSRQIRQLPVQNKSKYPYGKEPFKKKVHEDDQIYNRKQKQQREEQRQRQRQIFKEKQRQQRQQIQRQKLKQKRQKQQRDMQRQNNKYRDLDKDTSNDSNNLEENDPVWDQIFPKKKPVEKVMAKKPHQPIYNANKVIQNNSNVGNANLLDKNREYEKPWLKNIKKKQEKQGSSEEKKTFLKTCYPDGQGPDSNLIEMLERQVVDHSPNITFDDIAELQKAKDVLQETVLLPLVMPHLFKGIRRPWKGVLLFGPPGTGKTLLAKAIASTGKTTFFNVTASSIASKWKGESEKLVRILFQMAKFYAPTTIFIDEIDSLASARGQKQDQSSRKVKTQLMTRIDGASTGGTQDNKLIVVVGATNRPWDLDQAIRRRLQKRIYIPLPTQIGRRQLFKINLKNTSVEQSVQMEQIVQLTEGYSGADIANLCRQAAYMPMRRMLKKQGGIGRRIGDGKWMQQFQKEANVPLTRQDFIQAVKNVKPSVGKNDLINYQKWMQQFGQQGTK